MTLQTTSFRELGNLTVETSALVLGLDDWIEGPSQGLEIQKESGEFPDRLMVRILGFHCCGLGLILGGGTENPQASWCDQKKKEEYVV